MFIVTEKYMPDTDPNCNQFSTVLHVLMKLTTVLGTSMSISAVLFCSYDPRATIFLAEWIPLAYYRYLPVGVLFVLFHSYLIVCLGLNFIITGNLFIAYLYSVTIFYTKELVLGQNRYNTLNTLRSNQENLRHAFRSFQILNSNIMSWLGNFLTFFHSVAMILPTFGNFVLITYWKDLFIAGKISIVCSAWGAFSFWTVTLQLGKYLYVRGDRILRSWKGVWWGTRKDTRVMNKFRKSCRPVLIHNGSLLVIARITQFKYMKGVVRGTFRSLLTLTRKI